MPEIETMLREAIAHGTEGPAPVGLSAAVRERARVRRRRTVGATLGAGLAVAVVVTGVAVLAGGDGASPLADDPAPTASGGSHLRVETWRDLSLHVPVDWGHGVLDDWCVAGRDDTTPVVERPGGVSVDIACSPAEGYGVKFSDGALFDAAEPPGKVWQYHGGDVQMYPEGAWLGYQRTDNALAFVAAPDQASAEDVLSLWKDLGSDTPDENGCPPRIGTGWTLPTNPTDQVRLCRYSGDRWLEQSELLTGGDVADALAALDAAPAREGVRSCPAPDPSLPESRQTIVVQHGDSTAIVRMNWCDGLFGWGGVPERDLSPDLVHWVLSPGWNGGVPDGLSVGPRQ